MEILISFNFEDVHLAEALQASLFMLDPDRQIVLSPASYGAVMFKQNIASGVYEADALVLLVGPKGISRWQKTELEIALQRQSEESNFPLVPLLAGNAQVPGILIPYDLKWMKLPVVTDRKMLRLLLDEIRHLAGD